MWHKRIIRISISYTNVRKKGLLKNSEENKLRWKNQWPWNWRTTFLRLNFISNNFTLNPSTNLEIYKRTSFFRFNFVSNNFTVHSSATKNFRCIRLVESLSVIKVTVLYGAEIIKTIKLCGLPLGIQCADVSQTIEIVMDDVAQLTRFSATISLLNTLTTVVT